MPERAPAGPAAGRDAGPTRTLGLALGVALMAISPWAVAAADPAAPANAGPGNAAPGNAAPGYAPPGNASPGNASPGYAPPGYTPPGNASPGYAPQAPSSPTTFATPLAHSPERLAELADMIHNDCGACHGGRLRGGLGSSLRPEALGGKSAGDLAHVIYNGIPDTAMPPWSRFLTRDEALWIAGRLKKGPVDALR